MAKKSDSAGLGNLKAQLKSGTLRQIYLFFGEEDYLKEYYFGELKKKVLADGPSEFNFVLFEGGKIMWEQVDEALAAPPLMADKKLLLIRESGIFKTADVSARAYWERCLADLPEYVCVVFYEKEVDKRGALYKTVAQNGEAVECAYVEGVELYNWVLRGCRSAGLQIDRGAAEYLIAACDGGMNNLKQELGKLFSYCSGSITRADIDRVVTKMPQARVFEMINAIMKKDGHTVFLRLGELKTLKESPFMVLSLLCGSFSRILHAKLLCEEGSPHAQVASALGIPPFFVKDYTAAAHCFDKAFLRRAVCACAEIDFAVKQGKVEAWLAVEQFLAECVSV